MAQQAQRMIPKMPAQPERDVVQAYCTKHVELLAMQFTGTSANCAALKKFIGDWKPSKDFAGVVLLWKDEPERGGWIETLEGRMEFKKEDFIVRGLIGEFYPCNATAFDRKYELVSDRVAREKP